MSENRDTRAIFSASHCVDEFALIHAGHMTCFSKVRFSLAFLSLKPFSFSPSLEFVIQFGYVVYAPTERLVWLLKQLSACHFSFRLKRLFHHRNDFVHNCINTNFLVQMLPHYVIA